MSEQSNPWRGRRVLVTGCTGFLGSAVTNELLARGADVVGLVHHTPASDVFDFAKLGRVRFIHGRADNVFRLHSAMAVNEVTTVFHLTSHPPFGEDRNTAALLQAVNLYSRRVPVVTARPISLPAIARTEEPREERLSVVRFGEVFGPGDRKLFRVVPATVREILHGEPATPTDGPARDFVFIRDAARACLLAAEAAGPGDHTFRSGRLMTERQMAAAIRDAVAGRAVESPDSAPVSNPLGWQPSLSLGEALGETLAWYRANDSFGTTHSIRAAA